MACALDGMHSILASLSALGPGHTAAEWLASLQASRWTEERPGGLLGRSPLKHRRPAARVQRSGGRLWTAGPARHALDGTCGRPGLLPDGPGIFPETGLKTGREVGEADRVLRAQRHHLGREQRTQGTGPRGLGDWRALRGPNGVRTATDSRSTVCRAQWSGVR